MSFWFVNYLFTITIAESISSKSSFRQIEIEYDGHRHDTKTPIRKSLPSLFDQVIPILLPKSAMHFTTKTKQHWLKSIKDLTKTL